MAAQLLYAAPRCWPPHLRKLFVPVGPEAASAVEFLQGTPRAPLLHTVLHHALCCLPVDDFDVNAWLDIYPLHLLTRDQLGLLFSAAGLTTPISRALDIGAGGGFVTAELRQHCREVVVAETSKGMARQLERLGYRVWCEDIAATASRRVAAGDGAFSLVSILNVLDRCASPKSMLAAAHKLLAPTHLGEATFLLLATPLPFNAAYFGWKTLWSGRPLERLGLAGELRRSGSAALDQEEWGAQAAELVQDVLPAAGFEPQVLSRVPYLCAGDAFVPFSELDDLVVLARRVE